MGEEIRDILSDAAPSIALASVWHAVRLARMSVMSARLRRESCGLHYNTDCPHYSASGAALYPSRRLLNELPEKRY